MPAALVVGAGFAGLATAYRLRRSGWETVVVDNASGPSTYPLTLNGSPAARRLGLCHKNIRAALHCDVRYGVTVRELEQDRFGVTVTLTDGDYRWFDLVVGTEVRAWVPKGTSCGQVVLLDASLTLEGAEMLGDAFDLFPDPREALAWWEETLTSELLKVGHEVGG